ncbi:hypothetical protein ACQ4PT_047153 [Festuca glaucescens]
MIPALRGLSSMVVSFGDSDEVMPAVDQTPRKRPVEETEEKDILKIRTSRRNERDIIAWHPEKSGVFTVRSAYRLAFEEQLRADGWLATSEWPRGESPDWKLIWQCPVPPKVRIFPWKLANNDLATQVNMNRRGMKTPATCLICGTEDENTYHAMVKFPHERGLWKIMEEVWELPDKNVLFDHNPDWFLHAPKKLNIDQRVSFLMLLWRACRQLIACADALEAKLTAMEEGLALALHLTTESIVLESDCAEAIKLIADGGVDYQRKYHGKRDSYY